MQYLISKVRVKTSLVFKQLIIINALCCSLISCQHLPSPLSLSSDLITSVVTTSTHQHWLIKKPAALNSLQLHVYIEGDGSPWQTPYQIASDPTPRHPLMLELMRRDLHPGWYLGRPCYFNRAEFGLSDTGCTANLWTNGRYSEEVVVSMVTALRFAIADSKTLFSGITLIGHSGGGTLAMLMAMRMPEITQLVTVAANLDTAAWAEHHQFSPLTESLNPARLIQTSIPVQQLHFAGGQDQQVPLEPVRHFLTRINQSIQVFEKQDHHNWSAVWPQILLKMDAQAD